MSNHDRITEIYNDLRKRGIVRNIKDLSDLLDVSYTNFTQAMKGDPVRLTESLMSKVEALYASYNPDSPRPLPQQKTEDQIRPGSIVIPPELAQMFTDLAATIRSQQQTIEHLTRAGEGLSEKGVG